VCGGKPLAPYTYRDHARLSRQFGLGSARPPLFDEGDKVEGPDFINSICRKKARITGRR